MARVVFLGTPEAAVPTLDALTEVHDVVLVVTQPDRPRGRSARPVPPPVKESATTHGLEVTQPTNQSGLVKSLSEHGPFDVGVVVAYGRILGADSLTAPDHGLLNVHFSLLPRWRGAAPVARALMAGDPMTGVTIMRLEEGLDTGPILTAQAIDIPEGLNAGQLTERLAGMGAHLLVEVIPRYLTGEIHPVVQTDEGATYADKIEKSDRPLDPDVDAETLVATVRGLAPSPAATLDIDGDTHKIYEARTVDTAVEPRTWAATDGRLLVGLANSTIEVINLQPPGKTTQSGSAWINGRHTGHGSIS